MSTPEVLSSKGDTEYNFEPGGAYFAKRCCKFLRFGNFPVCLGCISSQRTKEVYQRGLTF